MSKPILIGVAGGTASGKTTFAKELQARLQDVQTTVLHMDDYYLPEEKRPRIQAPVTGKCYRDDNVPEALDMERLLRAFRSSLDQENDVVILEGLFALWEPEIWIRLDLKLFVDCLADERVVRRIKRHLSWGEDFGEITARYLDAVRCRHDEYVEPTKWRADFILNGSQPSAVAVSLIENWIRNEIKKRKG